MNEIENIKNLKKLRAMKHDHNPVNGAMGNFEAFERLLKGEIK